MKVVIDWTWDRELRRFLQMESVCWSLFVVDDDDDDEARMVFGTYMSVGISTNYIFD